MSLVAVIATLFNLAGIGLGVVALATTSWITPGIGLFQKCIHLFTERCEITIGDDEIIVAVACLICVGLVLSIPAVVLLFIDLLSSNKRKLSGAGALLLISSILVAAGAATFTILRKPDGFVLIISQSAFGYSYYMAWGSCGGLFLAALFAFIGGCRSD